MELYFELRLVLAILTCYRLARLLADDDGPFFIFKRVRYWIRDKAYWDMTQNGINPSIETVKDRWWGKWHNLAEGIECPYCTGVWMSFLVIWLLVYPTYSGDLFLVLMSLSGGQSALEGLKKK